MQDLKEVTNAIHYETFRKVQLTEQQKNRIDLTDIGDTQESKI